MFCDIIQTGVQDKAKYLSFFQPINFDDHNIDQSNTTDLWADLWAPLIPHIRRCGTMRTATAITRRVIVSRFSQQPTNSGNSTRKATWLINPESIFHKLGRTSTRELLWTKQAKRSINMQNLSPRAASLRLYSLIPCRLIELTLASCCDKSEARFPRRREEFNDGKLGLCGELSADRNTLSDWVGDSKVDEEFDDTWVCDE